MNRKLLFGILGVLILLVSIHPVHAIDILDSVLQPFRGTDIGKLYETYGLFIDAILYLLLFLGLAQVIYVKAYGKKEGKIIAVAVALALTFGMAVMESKSGFRLSGLMPIGALILMFILFILLYNLFQGVFNDGGASFSLAFLIMYAFLMSTFSPLYKWLETHAPLLAALVHIAMVISFIMLIIKLIGMFPSKKPDANSTTTTTPTNTTSTTPTTPATSAPNKITLTSPTNNQKFNTGDRIRIAFEVEGPELMKEYDYEVRLDDAFFASRVPKVRGNQVWPFPTRAGIEIPAGRHVLHVIAFKRGWISGGSNKVITQSNVIEIDIAAGPTGITPPDLIDLIVHKLDTRIYDFFTAYVGYAKKFYDIVNKHHKFITRASPVDVSAGEWVDLLKARANMITLSADVNTIITAIYSHADFATLTPTNLGILSKHLRRNTDLRIVIINYEKDLRKAYLTGSAPKSVPTP